MTQQIQRIPIDKLVAHPGNPNRMSSGTFNKLVRNIERTGRYEPIIVRAVCSVPRDASSENTQNAGCITQYEIINGHHRVKALRQLGFETADCLIWDVDDHEADILLATLNRLGGTDVLDKKLSLLRRLSKKSKAAEMARLLPQNARQIERLKNLKPPAAPANTNRASLLNPLAFFVNDTQYETIRRAMSLAIDYQKKKTKAAGNAAALTRIAEWFTKKFDNQ